MKSLSAHQAVLVADIPVLGPADFTAAVVAECKSGLRLLALPIVPGEARERWLVGVLARDSAGCLELLRMQVPDDGAYPSITAALPQAQAFERELAEEHGLRPEGHPWLKPLRRHSDLDTPGAADEHVFFRMEGAGVHEVAVGPVHAGIIEPGHFRFQCYGETVHTLEIQLGYQKRGAEKMLLEAKPLRRLAIAETIAGDTTLGHGTAYLDAMEALAGVEVPVAAQQLRAIALELERLANHTGDLGALCNDVGYLPGASWYGRLRGDFLNLSLEMSGTRFGRGLLVHGGVRFTIPAAVRTAFLSRFEEAAADFERIADVIFDAPSVMSRFEGTGTVSRSMADQLGLVGPVARACGCDRDARRDHPSGFYRRAGVGVAVRTTGDVLARAEVRREEAGHSVAFVRAQVHELLDGELRGAFPDRLRPSSIAVGMVEGWRGDVVHVATSDREGRLGSYKIVDPSFHNWFGLAMALRGNQISDFPLCNKSFNLSYAGHDL